MAALKMGVDWYGEDREITVNIDDDKVEIKFYAPNAPIIAVALSERAVRALAGKLLLLADFLGRE